MSMRIWPLGDSITAGQGSSTGDGYRWWLANRLTGTAGLTQANYVGTLQSGQEPNRHHEGHSGYTIDQIAAGVPGWWQQIGGADYVLLHAGTNDALSSTLGPTMATRLAALLDQLLDLGVRGIAVAALTPMLSNGPASVFQQLLNAALPGIVAIREPRVQLVDMSILAPGHLSDGEHPNDSGYDLMSWVWYQAFARLPGVSASGYLPASGCPLPFVPAV